MLTDEVGGIPGYDFVKSEIRRVVNELPGEFCSMWRLEDDNECLQR